MYYLLILLCSGALGLASQRAGLPLIFVIGSILIVSFLAMVLA